MNYPRYITKKDSDPKTKEKVAIIITGAYSYVKVVVSSTLTSATSVNNRHHKTNALFYQKGFSSKTELKKEYIELDEKVFMATFAKAITMLNIDIKKIRNEKQNTPKEHEA